VALPQLLHIPTGNLLPAGILYTSGAVDTSGGISGDARIGLGDVAELAIGTTDRVRARDRTTGADPERIAPYLMATFKMGVGEGRLFLHQPGLAIGFSKAFKREHDERETRVVELYAVASKHFGRGVGLHVGGVFWDATIFSRTKDDPADSELSLHDKSLSKQVRAFGGLELEPLDDAKILIDLSWIPEFQYHAASRSDSISIKATLAWGVRYQLTDWVAIESGVKVPDIAGANLIDSQIFGRFDLVARGIRRAIQSRR
jgi:hypothetical protein